MPTSKVKNKPINKPDPKTPAAVKPQRKPGSGGISRYSEEWAVDTCSSVAAGSNLTRLSKLPGGIPLSTMFYWLAEHPEFSERYARARELRADSRSDRIDDICEKVVSGELDPAAARVVIDAEKWQAGKERPARYGDRIEPSVTINHLPPAMTPELAADVESCVASIRESLKLPGK